MKPAEKKEQLNAKNFVAAFADQANRESTLLANSFKAYDAVELQIKIDALKAIIGGKD